MKGALVWSYAPYRPPLYDGGRSIYISRLAPGETGVTADWLPVDGASAYTVFYRLRGEEDASVVTVEKPTVTVAGLTKEAEYEIWVETAEEKSRVRLFRTGETVGTVVNYLHPEDPYYGFSGQYLCSPCLLRHPDGFLLASMDVFGHGAPQNLTLIFRSDDEGETWHYVTDLFPCFWGRMFIHRGELYMLACSTEYGDLLIGKSEDGGKTFATPTVLFRGGGQTGVCGVHKNPQPVVPWQGRLWNSMEWGSWKAIGTHASMLMSVPEDADLLDPANWEFTPPVPYDPAWEGTAKGKSGGTLEGCPVVAPDGKLYNIMRYQMLGCEPNFGRVLCFGVEGADQPLRYDRAIAFPGNHAKFVIRRDEATGDYYAIVCRIRDASTAGDRNLCSLIRSADLEHWELAADLIDGTDKDPKLVGFQYCDWIFAGEDILFLCRTGMNGAHSMHDTNYSTFHRVKNFRSLGK